MNGVLDWEESVLCTHELFCTHSARTYSTHLYIFRNCYARTYCTRTTSEVSTASIHVISVHTISTHTHVCSRTYYIQAHVHMHIRTLWFVLMGGAALSLRPSSFAFPPPPRRFSGSIEKCSIQIKTIFI